ncbi:MAG: ABC transporter ATP-binding protein [Nitrospinota bacterium]
MGLFRTEGLTHNFGGVMALREVDLEIREGEICGLIGPNGAGKTTFFNAVTGIYRPSGGRVFYRENDITGKPAHQIAALGVLRTYQKTSLFPGLSVRHNVSVGAHIRTRSGLWGALLNTPAKRLEEARRDQKVNQVLEFTGLSDRAEMEARNLSYGEQRILEVAIALAGEPELLLLDEPVAGLNPEEIQDVMKLVGEVNRRGVTILLVEHDMKMVMGVCQRIAVLDYGQKIAEGTPEEVSRNEKVIEIYLGEEVHLASD